VRLLCVIPAHNEAANLGLVVSELRAWRPDLHILVVDDGSIDGTRTLLPRLGVRYLVFRERRGIGGAMRAGLKYAARGGFDAIVRIDGDGQHRADQISRLVEPLGDGCADVVLGSRYVRRAEPPCRDRSLAQKALAAGLSALTRARVTDPTSGFCAIGPRALRLLAEYHPTGYPEPELRLFLSRNAIRVIEVAVQTRPRLNGRTSLTPRRLAAAIARVALAMLIVPLRARVGDAGRG
jgi:glycosyltransferase involved in cell wall biosynthesis